MSDRALNRIYMDWRPVPPEEIVDALDLEEDGLVEVRSTGEAIEARLTMEGRKHMDAIAHERE